MANGATEQGETIGTRLRQARKRKRLTQKGLAEQAGIGLATVRRIEQDDMEPRLETARRLAETLDIRAGWLVFGELPMASGKGEQ